MAGPRPENEERERRILDAAADLIIRYGYDKTTMADIAAAAGIGRGVLYLHFHSKDLVLDALISREFPRYAQAWLEHMEADPRGGTIGGLFRSVLYAINSSPFMAAIAKRDKDVFGSYLRKPNNMFASMQASSVNTEFVRAMQEARVIRRDIDAAAIAYITDTLSYSLVSSDDVPGRGEAPPFDDLMEAMGAMLDRALAPEDGGDNEAGKAAILRFVASARAQLEREQKKQAGSRHDRDRTQSAFSSQPNY